MIFIQLDKSKSKELLEEDNNVTYGEGEKRMILVWLCILIAIGIAK